MPAEARQAPPREIALGAEQAVRPDKGLAVNVQTERTYPLVIRSVAAERGEELGVKYQTEWKLAFPYATRRGLTGLEGLADAYVDYRALTDRLFDSLPLDKIAIERAFAAQPREWLLDR